ESLASGLNHTFNPVQAVRDAGEVAESAFLGRVDAHGQRQGGMVDNYRRAWREGRPGEMLGAFGVDGAAMAAGGAEGAAGEAAEAGSAGRVGLRAAGERTAIVPEPPPREIPAPVTPRPEPTDVVIPSPGRVRTIPPFDPNEYVPVPSQPIDSG